MVFQLRAVTTVDCWRVSDERGPEWASWCRSTGRLRSGPSMKSHNRGPSRPGGGADRLSGHYEAFVPDPLCGWEFAIAARLAGNLAEAEAAIRSLNGRRSRDLEGLGRFLVRAESVGSSWIEGLAVPTGRLAVAAEGIERDVDTGDRVAKEASCRFIAPVVHSCTTAPDSAVMVPTRRSICGCRPRSESSAPVSSVAGALARLNP